MCYNCSLELQVTSGGGIKAGHSHASYANLSMTAHTYIRALVFSPRSAHSSSPFSHFSLLFFPSLSLFIDGLIRKSSTSLTKTRVPDSQLRLILKGYLHRLAKILWLQHEAVLRIESLILWLEANSKVHHSRFKRAGEETGVTL